MSVKYWENFGCVGGVGLKFTVMLTFFLSIRVIPELLRDDALAPNISRKLILTGWPFTLGVFGIVLDRVMFVLCDG